MQIIPMKSVDGEDLFKTEFVRRKSMAVLDDSIKLDLKEETYTSQEDIKKIPEDSIIRRIPEGSEASSILVGNVSFLDSPTIAFVRLAQGVSLPNVTEINIPVRFVFVLLGPANSELDYHEVGRSISTLMSTKSFYEIAYRAENRKELLSAINEFMDDSLVLPPGNWDSEAVLSYDELKSKSDMIRKRKKGAIDKRMISEEKDEAGEALIIDEDDNKVYKLPPIDPLQKTGRPFGGS